MTSNLFPWMPRALPTVTSTALPPVLPSHHHAIATARITPATAALAYPHTA